MAQALVVYAVAALLLVAGSGPALQAMRDASLEEFEALGETRPLDEFPFLQRIQPYLPPLVVDWIVVQHDGPGDLPPGLDYRFDDEGRVIIIWPDGCEESEERYRADSECAPRPPDCEEEPTRPECGDPCADPERRTNDCVPPECPPGQMLDPDWPDADPACVPDPACEPNENGSRPAHCPTRPPIGRCGDGFIEAYDGSCIPTEPRLLAQVGDLRGPERDTRFVPLELRVPYANLSLEVSWRGVTTNPYWNLTLWNSTTGIRICFSVASGPQDDDCSARREAGSTIASRGSASYDDTDEGPIPAQNLTFQVSYASEPPGGHSLDVRLYGKPYEGGDGQNNDDA